jgi:hypothetical protein
LIEREYDVRETTRQLAGAFEEILSS